MITGWISLLICVLQEFKPASVYRTTQPTKRVKSELGALWSPKALQSKSSSLTIFSPHTKSWHFSYKIGFATSCNALTIVHCVYCTCEAKGGFLTMTSLSLWYNEIPAFSCLHHRMNKLCSLWFISESYKIHLHVDFSFPLNDNIMITTLVFVMSL